MNSKITFYIIRHGKTLLNTLDRVQGWCDSPLTQEGIKVAEYLGVGMKDVRFDAIYTSDLRRTRQTAEILLKEKGQADLPIFEKYGFREACFGSYESDFNRKMWGDASLFLQYTNMQEMYKDIFGGNISNRDVLNAISQIDHMKIAETFEQVESRSQAALIEVAENELDPNQDKTIAIVAHGMSIICMLFNLGGKELLKSHLDNAAVCEVIFQDGKFTVKSMGDMEFVNRGKEIKDKF